MVVVLATVFAILMVPAVSFGDTFTVRATGDDTFRPASKIIHRGDRIRWRNPSDSAHTVTATSGNWSTNVTLSPGEGFT